MNRCDWAGEAGSEMARYHDEEWGVPMHGERELFELLCLEGAQAGLSWSTILNRRDGYREAFENFDVDTVAAFSGDRMERLRGDSRIIRNRLKIRATVDNARAVVALRSDGGLDNLLWSFVGGSPVVNARAQAADVPAETPESTEMSRALKRLGFRFVGPTICYAFMQSAGMVNDHLVNCFRYRQV